MRCGGGVVKRLFSSALGALISLRRTGHAHTALLGIGSGTEGYALGFMRMALARKGCESAYPARQPKAEPA